MPPGSVETRREEPQKLNPDLEYSEILTFPDLTERAVLTRDFVLSVLGLENSLEDVGFQPLGKRRIKWSDWQKEILVAHGDKKDPRFFVLPGMPAGSPLAFSADGRQLYPNGIEDRERATTLREIYHTGYLTDRSEFFRTQEHDFIHVRQGAMVFVPRDRAPFFTLSLSECGAIIGVSKSGIAVAHTSYSSRAQTEAAINFMRRQGIELANVFVVANEDKTSEGQAAAAANVWVGDQIVSPEIYEEIGVPKGNIETFNFFHKKENIGPPWFEDWGDRIIEKNLARVVIAPDSFSFSLFDIFGAGQKRDSAYRLPKVVPFKI